MNVTVTYSHPDKPMQTVSVTDVTSTEAGIAKAHVCFGAICDVEGWAIAEFEIQAIEVKKTAAEAYAEYARTGLNDPRD